jgi:hypothetical protein
VRSSAAVLLENGEDQYETSDKSSLFYRMICYPLAARGCSISRVAVFEVPPASLSSGALPKKIWIVDSITYYCRLSYSPLLPAAPPPSYKKLWLAKPKKEGSKSCAYIHICRICTYILTYICMYAHMSSPLKSDRQNSDKNEGKLKGV